MTLGCLTGVRKKTGSPWTCTRFFPFTDVRLPYLTSYVGEDVIPGRRRVGDVEGVSSFVGVVGTECGLVPDPVEDTWVQ